MLGFACWVYGRRGPSLILFGGTGGGYLLAGAVYHMPSYVCGSLSQLSGRGDTRVWILPDALSQENDRERRALLTPNFNVPGRYLPCSPLGNVLLRANDWKYFGYVIGRRQLLIRCYSYEYNVNFAIKLSELDAKDCV